MGDTLDFKWQGWSKGGKNQNAKKSLGLQTKPKKTPRPKFNQKKSHAEFLSHKNFQKTLNEITITNLQIVLNTSQKSLLKSSCPKKNTCRYFLTQKNPEIENFKSKKILRSSLSLELRVPHPKRMLLLQNSPKNYCGKCSVMKFVWDPLCHSSGAFSVYWVEASSNDLSKSCPKTALSYLVTSARLSNYSGERNDNVIRTKHLMGKRTLHIQLNLSSTATLGTEESVHCREVETRVNVWTVRQKKWPLRRVGL